MEIKLAEPVFCGFQGEGPTQGSNGIFIRFVGCNANCLNCDTSYSWKKNEIKYNEYTHYEIFKEIEKYKTDKIIFTGGEPIGITSNFNDSLDIINEFSRYYFEYETNGIINKFQLEPIKRKIIENIQNKKRMIQFNISPKVNFPQEKKVDTTPTLINILQDIDYNNFIVKMLFKDKKDLDLIKEFQQYYELDNNQMWLQPIGIDAETLKKTIVDNYNDIINEGWNISMRSHIFLFGNKKGV
jgi:7-carboxy-7-deazaguanine synthase